MLVMKTVDVAGVSFQAFPEILVVLAFCTKYRAVRNVLYLPVAPLKASAELHVASLGDNAC